MRFCLTLLWISLSLVNCQRYVTEFIINNTTNLDPTHVQSLVYTALQQIAANVAHPDNITVVAV